MKGIAAGLAVFAIWLQLALSIGHLHATDVYGPVGHLVAAGHGPDTVAPPQTPSDPGPAGQASGDEDADGCAVCASLHLVEAASPPPTFALVPAETAAHVLWIGQVPAGAGTTPHPLARPRAPPIA